MPLAYGEDFLKRVYEALTSSPDKWSRTMMIVCYDEHGGFFDHVAPPAMKYAPPPGSGWVDAEAFETLGVRVPGIVISPLVEAKSSFHGLLDHTSILQLIVERFGAGDLATFGDAAMRKQGGVVSLSQTLTRASARSDILTLPAAPPVSGTATTPSVSTLGTMFRGVIADKPALARS